MARLTNSAFGTSIAIAATLILAVGDDGGKG